MRKAPSEPYILQKDLAHGVENQRPKPESAGNPAVSDHIGRTSHIM